MMANLTIRARYHRHANARLGTSGRTLINTIPY